MGSIHAELELSIVTEVVAIFGLALVWCFHFSSNHRPRLLWRLRLVEVDDSAHGIPQPTYRHSQLEEARHVSVTTT